MTRRGREYDDRKFFDSLRKQAAGGRVLSDKQRAALGKLADKYAGQLRDADLVRQTLGIPSAAPAAAPAPETGDAVSGMLDALSRVTNWAEPVKRGRVTFNDREFYESLRGQFDKGKMLSVKQIAALKKLAAKYRA